MRALYRTAAAVAVSLPLVVAGSAIANASTDGSMSTGPADGSTTNGVAPTRPVEGSTTNGVAPTRPVEGSTTNGVAPTRPVEGSTTNGWVTEGSSTNGFVSARPVEGSTTNGWVTEDSMSTGHHKKHHKGKFDVDQDIWQAVKQNNSNGPTNVSGSHNKFSTEQENEAAQLAEQNAFSR